MFWLIFIVALWGILHSLLASMALKNFFRHALGETFMNVYRLYSTDNICLDRDRF